MTDPFSEEVLELHHFLDAWLKGQTELGDGQPLRLARALADDFRVIHPDGNSSDKATAIANFARAYGEKPPTYALEVGVIDVRPIDADLCLATYVERHRGEPGRARIAGAILRRHADGRIEWLHLQETPAPHLDDA